MTEAEYTELVRGQPTYRLVVNAYGPLAEVELTLVPNSGQTCMRDTLHGATKRFIVKGGTIGCSKHTFLQALYEALSQVSESEEEDSDAAH